MILHLGDIPSPMKVGFQKHDLNAGGLCTPKNLILSDVVAPVDVEDRAEATLMETLKATQVATLGDPGFRIGQEGGRHDSSIQVN